MRRLLVAAHRRRRSAIAESWQCRGNQPAFVWNESWTELWRAKCHRKEKKEVMTTLFDTPSHLGESSAPEARRGWIVAVLIAGAVIAIAGARLFF
jgi:hypothetical protein